MDQVVGEVIKIITQNVFVGVKWIMIISCVGFWIVRGIKPIVEFMSQDVHS